MLRVEFEWVKWRYGLKWHPLPHLENITREIWVKDGAQEITKATTFTVPDDSICYLQPKPGVTKKYYFPFLKWEKGDTPYLELVNLTRVFNSGRNLGKAILQFVNKNGLLGILFWKLQLGSLQTREDHLLRYFPDGQWDFNYHADKERKVSPENPFYSEQVDEFIRVANRFAELVSAWHTISQELNEPLPGITLKEIHDPYGLERIADRLEKQKELAENEREQLGHLIKHLELSLISSFGNAFPVFDLRKKEWGIGYRPTSLMEAYYLMFVLDIIAFRKIRWCLAENCKRFFVPRHERQIYCSPRCSAWQRKKRFREKRGL